MSSLLVLLCRITRLASAGIFLPRLAFGAPFELIELSARLMRLLVSRNVMLTCLLHWASALMAGRL